MELHHVPKEMFLNFLKIWHLQDTVIGSVTVLFFLNNIIDLLM